MSIRRELIDELLKDYPNPQDVLAEDGLLKQLTKAVISTFYPQSRPASSLLLERIFHVASTTPADSVSNLQ